MNILYDISTLGLSVHFETARTGIARTIESLAAELHRLAPAEFSLCASLSVPQLLQTLSYLKNRDDADGYRFSQPEGLLARAMLPLLSRVYPRPGGSALIRRAFNFSLNATGSWLTSPGAKDLARADIFHATLYPCPKRIESIRRIARFLTIYDLIPILYPQYFQNNPNHFIRQIVAGITPDQWVLAISQNTKNDLCNFAGIDPSRVFVTHLAASDIFYPCNDSDMLAAVRLRHKIPDGHYVLSLSTLEPRKNIDQTIRSYVDLVKQQGIRDLSLVLVGTKGWDFDRIFSEIGHASSFTDRIIVTGYVRDEDLAALYSGAMMFVYPSFYEGFGLPPLEAMQCGVPVITSNTSSLPEVVGNAGQMVDPTDQDALTQAMYRLYRSEALRRAMAAQALTRAKHFSWNACATATLSAYRTAHAQQGAH